LVLYTLKFLTKESQEGGSRIVTKKSFLMILFPWCKCGSHNLSRLLQSLSDFVFTPPLHSNLNFTARTLRLRNQVSLRRKYTFLLPQAGSQDVYDFLHQENNKLRLFLMN
jgi:hypothetical protein